MLSRSGSELRIEYPYAEDGLDTRGMRLPDIPILWLELQVARAVRFRGACIVDTGFDAGLYANEDLTLLLEGLAPIREDILHTVGQETITCEVFQAKAFLTPPTVSRRLRSLGTAEIFVPVLPDHLSLEVIVGRGILNRLAIIIDGQKTVII